MMSGSTPATPSATSSVSSVESEAYKSVDNQIIPRESHLRQQLVRFFSGIHNDDPRVSLHGHEGLKRLTQAERAVAFDEVKNTITTNLYFFAFSNLKSINNWHMQSKRGEDLIIRRYLAIKYDNLARGAISFTIESNANICEINLLQIKEAYQKKHFGTTLLHAAILVALLYKCRKVKLFSLDNDDTLRFYDANGFNVDESRYHVLDFSNSSSCKKLTEKFKLTAPHFDLQELIDKVKKDKPSKTTVLSSAQTSIDHADFHKISMFGEGLTKSKHIEEKNNKTYVSLGVKRRKLRHA